MSVIVTVTETTGNEITVTTDQVVITTNSVAVGDAGDISFTPVGTLTATNIQDALHQVADQQFRQGTAPTTSATELVDEGDLWFNTTDNKLMVYRNTTWEEVVIAAQLAESSDTSEYHDVTLNGGYF